MGNQPIDFITGIHQTWLRTISIKKNSMVVKRVDDCSDIATQGDAAAFLAIYYY